MINNLPHSTKDWSTSMLMEVDRQLKQDSYWEDCYSGVSIWNTFGCVHLAVFHEPYLGYILDGKKTVESRFSINRISPFGRVSDSDIVLLKRASGPICGACTISRVWNYDLTEIDIDFIKQRFSKRLCLTSTDFWGKKTTANYATLMLIESVFQFVPFSINKRDRRSWITFD